VELDQLQQIIQLLKAEGLTEITVCEGDQRITVKQDLSGAAVRPTSPPVLVESEPPAEGMEDSQDTLTLTAPLVGTFYRRPSTDAEPFVSPGDVVSPGDTLCLIEAMKVMNEINAEEAGRVRRVLAADGEAVEYGQPLFVFDRL
jgi:acetyl-CoA carboxylase biotin carboxyl carrier protein